MPRVQQYTPEVANDGGMSGRQDVAAPAGAFGVDPSAVASVGQSVDNTAKYIQQWDEQQDEARAKMAATTVTPSYRATLYGADDGSTPGYLSTMGVNALNGREQAEKAINDAYSIGVSQAQNPRQMAMLQTSLGAQRDAALQQIAEHSMAQEKVFHQAASAAAATEHGNNFTAMQDSNPAEAAAQLAAGEMEIRRSNTYAGLGPDTEAEAIQAYHTKVYGQYIDNALANHAGGALKAQQFFNVNQGYFDPATRAQYADKIRTASKQFVGATLGQALINSGASVPAGTPNLPGGSVISAVRAAGGGDTNKTNFLLTAGTIESGLSANPKSNGSSQGTFQMHPDTFYEALPGGDITSPADQAKAAGVIYDRNLPKLKQALGRAPTLMESYLAYQQNFPAAKALLKADPNANAVQTLMDAGVYHSRALATQAIAGNGGSPNITAGQFLNTWTTRVAAKAHALSSAQGGNVNQTSGGVVGMPDEGAAVQLATSISQRLFPGDPEAAQDIQAAARGAVGNLVAARGQAETEADRQIALLFASDNPPTDISQISPNLISKATPSTQKATYAALSKTDSGGIHPKQSDDETLAGLYALHGVDDGRLAKVNPMSVADKLSESDWKMFLSWQNKPDAAPKQVSYKTTTEIGNTLMNAAGYTGQQHTKDRAQFQVALQRETDAWRAQNPNKEPALDDIRKMGDGLLLQGRWQNGQGWFGPNMVSGPAFRAPTGTPIAVSVPKPAQDRIVASYAKNRPGRPPSAQEIQQAYVRGHAAGLFGQ